MEQGKIMLLMQLANKLSASYAMLKKSYEDSEKEDFQKAKSSIIDIQKKINNITKNK